MPSVLQPWVENIGLRHQGVLLSAARGCDVAPKYDPSKLAQRLLRGAFMESHCGRSVKPVSYIVREDNALEWWKTMNGFLGSWDHYPNHYVVHFIHATEIIAYYGPNEWPVYSSRWLEFYRRACHLLHVNPETREQLAHRLDADEANFKKMQDALGER